MRSFHLFLLFFIGTVSIQAQTNKMHLENLIGESIHSDSAKAFLAHDEYTRPDYESKVEYYLLFKNSTIVAVVENDSIHTFFLNNTYKGPIPKGLTFEMSMEQVTKLLGKPDQIGSEVKWEKYVYPQYAIHIEYTDGKVGMITIMDEEKFQRTH